MGLAFFRNITMTVALCLISSCALTNSDAKSYDMVLANFPPMPRNKTLEGKLIVNTVSSLDAVRFKAFGQAIYDWLENYGVLTRNKEAAVYALDVDMVRHEVIRDEPAYAIFECDVRYTIHSIKTGEVVFDELLTSKFNSNERLGYVDNIGPLSAKDAVDSVASVLIFGVPSVRASPAVEQFESAKAGAIGNVVRENIHMFISRLMKLKT